MTIIISKSPEFYFHSLPLLITKMNKRSPVWSYWFDLIRMLNSPVTVTPFMWPTTITVLHLYVTCLLPLWLCISFFSAAILFATNICLVWLREVMLVKLETFKCCLIQKQTWCNSLVCNYIYTHKTTKGNTDEVQLFLIFQANLKRWPFSTTAFPDNFSVIWSVFIT